MPIHRSSLRRALLRAVLAATFASTTLAAVAADDANADAPSEQRRCGWLSTQAGDAVLSDRDGDWLLARAGTPAAAGDWRPAFGAGQSVTTVDGSVGCACLVAQADPANHRIAAARAPQARPLAACRGDRALELPSALQPGHATTRTYRTKSFSLDVPAPWRVRVKNGCVAMSVPGQRRIPEDFTLQVCDHPGTLAQAADEEIISPDEHGVWTRSAGPSADSPAAWMFGPGWDAVTAVQSCGVEDEVGFHAGGGLCLVFAASDGTHGAIAESNGFWTDFDRAHAILRTLRFDAK